MFVTRKSLATLAGLLLLSVAAQSALNESPFAQETKTYIYQPGVFADLYLGPSVPENTAALTSYVWYIRPGQAACALFGMKALASFLQSRDIPGVDFRDNPLLTNSDLSFLLNTDFLHSFGSLYRFIYLNVQGTLMDDDSLPALDHLTDLQVLLLNRRVSDKGVRFLKDLGGLKVLGLSSPNVSDASMETVSRLRHLEALDLGESSVGDAGLRKLIHLPLKHLTLGRGITDKGLRTLAAMTTLTQLDLNRSSVTQIGLRALFTLSHLHTLFLGPSLSDADMPELSHFENLKRLDLSGAPITDATADIWPRLQNLEELALTQTQIGNGVLEKLGALPHLRYLEVSDTVLTPENLKNLNGFSALQSISFSSNRRLHSSDLEGLARLPHLHSILVNGILMGPALVESLRRSLHTRSHGGLGFIGIAEAEGDSIADVEHALETAQKPISETTLHERSFKGIQGLARIHEAESSLDDVSSATPQPKVDTFEENEKNFLGEITIGVASSRMKS